MANADEPDDYMSMDFSNVPSKPVLETSLQRKQRLRREAEIKGRPKSKAELAADEAAARDHALSKSLLDPTAPAAQKSKGLAMMKKMGFVAGSTLGAQDGAASANAEPIRISIKEDRSGIGLDAERKRKVDEAAEQQGLPPQGKRPKINEGEFRDRVRKEREAARTERQVYAAQKVAEMLDEEGQGQSQQRDAHDTHKSKSRALSTRPLKRVHVVWRGLVRQREEAERDRRMRHDLEQSLSCRLPTYGEEVDDEDDADTRQAMGKSDQVVAPFEDLEEEDAELDEFNGLEPDARLQRLVAYLRDEFRYCFWCKCAYPDKKMDGCPGLTEEDHD